MIPCHINSILCVKRGVAPDAVTPLSTGSSWHGDSCRSHAACAQRAKQCTRSPAEKISKIPYPGGVPGTVGWATQQSFTPSTSQSSFTPTPPHSGKDTHTHTHTHTPCRCAALDVPRGQAHGQVSDEVVTGLTGAVAGQHPPTRRLGKLDSLQQQRHHLAT
jgi:hypothetical protein